MMLFDMYREGQVERDLAEVQKNGGLYRRNAGGRYSRAVTGIDLDATVVFDTGEVRARGHATDEILRVVGRFGQLEVLSLDGSHITDAGLVHLKRLKALRQLRLAHTEVSNAGLGHLRGLSALEVIDLRGTKVTETGVMELQRTLPRTQILSEDSPRQRREEPQLPAQQGRLPGLAVPIVMFGGDASSFDGDLEEAGEGAPGSVAHERRAGVQAKLVGNGGGSEGPGGVHVAATIEMGADCLEPCGEARRIQKGLAGELVLVAGGGDDGIVAGDDQVGRAGQGGDEILGGRQLVVRDLAPRRDVGARGVEGEDLQMGVDTTQPGVVCLGGEVGEVPFETSRAMGPHGVAIVVARDDGNPGWVSQQARQGGSGVVELGGEGCRGEVAGDQKMICMKALDSLDQLGHALEPELTAAPDDEIGRAQKALAEETERVKCVAPEVNV